MPVTFQVAEHPAREFKIPERQGDGSPQQLLGAACPHQAKRCAELLQSSIQAQGTTGVHLVPRSNGFVHAVLEAYGGHYHLKIKPDDVWIAILVQLSYYVNAHAEDLRAYFVAHEEKKRLVVCSAGTRHTVDYADLARRMSAEIHKNVVDKTLVEWVLPDFSTTTHKDTTVCAVALMSTLQGYFDYTFAMLCGIPSVTLEGTRADWARLLARLDRLPELGAEPAAWACLLRPILSRFVGAFDGAPDASFWAQAVFRHPMCGGDRLSGWITAFCAWSDGGRWCALPPAQILRAASEPPAAPAPAAEDAWWGSLPHDRRALVEAALRAGTVTWNRYGPCVLDGVPYHGTGLSDLPAGFVEVPVTIDDHGAIFPSMMVAGHVALAVSASAESEGGGVQYDTVRPSAEWFMFIKNDYDEKKERERRMAPFNGFFPSPPMVRRG